jgi:two-component system, NarL family, sensor histidine kinase UhpB
MPLSIKSRLNVLIGTVLVLALAANVAVIVRNAGPRIRAEDVSIRRLTQQTVERALLELEVSSDPSRELASLLDRLSSIRHAHVYLEPPAWIEPKGIKREAYRSSRATQVPNWFVNLVASGEPPLRFPATYKNALLGTIVIASNPSDEIAEIWDAFSETLTGGLALIAVIYTLTTLAVRHALMPVQNLGVALRLMQKGNYNVRLAQTGPPELAEISGNVNDLAGTLFKTRARNSALAEQMLNLEDLERRELARELHDEFGPYLFAIRATVTALHTQAERDHSIDGIARAKSCQVTLEHIAALQQLNRRVLHRLRPPALSELGLHGALATLLALWRQNNPDVTITLSMNCDGIDLDDTTQLTVYRVVQEGLTNALRHAGASVITIAIAPLNDVSLAITVADNGNGLQGAAQPGFGLSGMSERVWALGGTMTMANATAGGCVLTVELPALPAEGTQPAKHEAAAPAT